MTISFTEATRMLLAGKALSWSAFEGHKSGTVTLSTSGQRRLFNFLLSQDRAKVARADEELFPELIAAWKETTTDPATNDSFSPSTPTTDIWLLDRIEASGLGGLTLFGGPSFDLRVGSCNWCLYGQNGSGKTSLVSAILWALTGKRIRDQEGPIDERGERSDVMNEAGKKLGNWPSFASYPAVPAELIKPVEVSVQLTFVNQKGETALAYRRMTCPTSAAPTLDVTIDPRLLAAPELLETGLLMPARLARIGFGEKSTSLYEAVKMLTGLDQLADIADGCVHLTHGNRRFLRYGKDNGLDSYAAKFAEEIKKASAKAAELKFPLPQTLVLGSKTLIDDLKSVATAASAEAGSHLTVLKSEIALGIDTATPQGRAEIRKAVGAARAIVNQKTRGIDAFSAWASLKEAHDDAKFQTLPSVIEQTRARLERALSWHSKQIADQKFRLKALAAQFFIPEHQHSSPEHCPLCESLLSTVEQQTLAAQLAELKKDSAEAERKLDDVCLALEADLVACLSAGLKQHRDLLATMDPKASYGLAVRERFCETPPFSDVLHGLAERVKDKVSKQEATLPTFTHDSFKPIGDEPDSAVTLRRSLHAFEQLLQLVLWWSEHRSVFLEAWLNLIGQKQEDDTYPKDSVEGELQTLEEALSKADPLDELSRTLTEAANAATAWIKVYQEQDLRVAIASALETLKDLRFLVAAETARSIANLSNRISKILDRIHLNERLTYEQTSLGKQAVHVSGSFEPGMQIDASLVANTSWLRAILWAFILALREEKIESIGLNPFPLMVLDDPQTSFDPRNKRKWAEELARMANLDGSAPEKIQLFLTTHERQFYQCIVDIEHLSGEQGLIGGANKTTGVTTVVNASWLQRAWQEASNNNDDERARDYIADVRIYCEDLLKFMLRGESPNVPNLTLGDLTKTLKQLREKHIPPFDRPPFIQLFNTLNGGGGKAMKLINEPHHHDDESIGLAEATDVKAFWEKTLMPQIHDAFATYDQFESFYGEPRSFPWAKTVIPFPSGFRDDVRALVLRNTGVAAAAKTDGRAGDGVITVTEWEKATEIVLSNHEIYQLAAGTLDPVAAVGDLVIVCNHAKINPRNLVVAAFGNALLARRFNNVDAHPEVAVLTGQSVDPYAIPEPVIIAPEAAKLRKIVGTLFAAHRLQTPAIDPDSEVVPLIDLSVPKLMLNGARLFEVEGRSAEPIALEGQFLITQEAVKTADQIKALDGRAVVAFDSDGTRYFKRLRCNGEFAILESLNQDGSTGAELLSFGDNHGLPKLTQALEVVGILFELPED